MPGILGCRVGLLEACGMFTTKARSQKTQSFMAVGVGDSVESGLAAWSAPSLILLPLP